VSFEAHEPGKGEPHKMPRGDKGKYTGKQKRQAEHIEEGYEERGVSEEEAEKRAWATVNKMTGGGKQPGGSGRGKKMNTAPAKKGGKKGGAKGGAKKGGAKKSASKGGAKKGAAKKGGAKKGASKKGGAKKGAAKKGGAGKGGAKK
jgi:hypothetical protein